MALPRWVKRFWNDLIKREFIPIKILFFIIYGASWAMFPFLTLQARSLGINEKELGIVYAFNPVVAIVGPPLTGMIADKMGNFKFFLSMTMAASGCAALIFSAVPYARVQHRLPENLSVSVACDGLSGADPAITIDKPYNCDYQQRMGNISMIVRNCALCGTNTTLDFIDDVEIQLCEDDGPFTEECKIRDQLANANHSLTAIPVRNSTGNVTQLKVLDWTCPSISLEGIDLLVADALQYTSSLDVLKTRATNCTVRCDAMVNRDDLCSNKFTEEVFDPFLSFWCYLLVRVLNSLTLATSFTLLEGAAVALVKEFKGDFGLQRLYANLGGVVITPISGQLMDYFSAQNNMEDYRPAFYMYCALKILGSVIILFVDLDFRQPSNEVLKDFKVLIKNAEILTFLLVCTIAGTTYGLLDTFLFWLLEDLGSSKFLMGITVTVGNIAGVPILIASSFVFKRLGLANTIILGLLVYVIRMIGYSFLTNAWWCMPFESMECFTTSLLGTAAVAYAAELATPATLATLQGMYGGLHYGVGRGIGSLMGGFLLQPIGVRGTFQVMAGICGITAIVYFIINRLFFQAKQDERRKIAQEEKKKEREDQKDEVDANMVKEKENGMIENGVALPDSDSEVIENIKNKENGGENGAYNAGYVADE